MDEQRIERALRAGPPDEQPHQQGALGRALGERERSGTGSVSFRFVTPRTSSTFVALVAAAVIIAIIVVAAPRFAGPGSTPSAVQVGSASPSTSTAPATSSIATSTGAAAVLTALVDRWLGPPPAAGDPAPRRRALLEMRGAEIRYTTDAARVPDRFISSVAATAADELGLTSVGSDGGCRAYDEGRYRWTLSGADTTLTLTAVSDACGNRAAALAGVWTHTACRDANQDCLGPLDPGSYASTALDLDRSGSAGQLRYTVPEGWANTIDFGTNYFIRPMADYLADPSFDGNDTVSGIYVWAGTIAAAQPADCAGVAADGVAPRADAIATYFASMPGLAVVDGGTTTIDGRSARLLDLHVAPDATGTCPWAAGRPFRSLITMADLGPDRGIWGLVEGEGARVLLVDVAPGRVASIWIDAPSDRLPALIDAAMPIVRSFRFVTD